jgi:cell division protein FtsA
MRSRLFPPRMKQLAARRSATMAVLDVGTSKIACLIARLTPVGGDGPSARGRTHRARVLGIGHQRSRGVKAGQIVDMEEAEGAIRRTVDAAERMARTQVDAVIVTASGGRLDSQHFAAKTRIEGGAVAACDVHRVLEASATHVLESGRVVLHSLPAGFSLDGSGGIREPAGMVGAELGVDLHVASVDQAAMRNLLVAVERGHLGVEAAVAAPYVAGLAVLEADEAELGAIVIDMGAGVTSLAVFSGGTLVHADAVTLGGNHVTMDIARGLDCRLADAERLKTLHGAAISSLSDERETVAFDHVGETGEHPAHAPKSHLVRIIRPRVEETLEFLRDRLAQAGYPAHAGRRIVLTGGSCLLTGLPEAARRILGGQVRVGRPAGIDGLPESAKSPAFAAAVGLLVYPQFAGREYFEPRREPDARATGTGGYIARVGQWLRESF